MVHHYLIVVALTLLLSASWLFVRRLMLRLHGVVTLGWVDAFERCDRDGGTCLLPIVAYHDHEGRPQRFTARTGTGNRRPAAGARVKVLYPRHQPAHGLIVSFVDLWAAPLTFAAVGAATLVAAWFS